MHVKKLFSFFYSTLSAAAKSRPASLRQLAVLGLLAAATLACATNTPVAQVAAPRPTRTPLPTFTNTPLPPTDTPVPTPTDTPPVTDTPIPTATPPPTDASVSPTDTPEPTTTPVPPTNTPAPRPTPVPPTNTPVPTPTAAPAPVSPLATPTNTPVTGSPPGKYLPRSIEQEANCAHVGVTGNVRDGDDDDDSPPVANVTIQVIGDEDGFRGPYFATTDDEGRYGMVIGEFGKVPDRVEFKAEVFGDGTDTDDRPEWQFSDNCHDDDANQVMIINWRKK